MRRHSSKSPPAQYGNFESLRRHIEAERRRLTDAEAVLDCLIHAMEEEDEPLDEPGLRYPNVVGIARETSSAPPSSGSIRSTFDPRSSQGLIARRPLRIPKELRASPDSATV